MTTIVRSAFLADMPAIVDLGVESVSREPLPVTISRKAMLQTLRPLVGHPMHFAWVTEVDGTVVASVVAQSSYGFWFERQQCSVLLYYGRAAGSVMPLLRALVRWIKARPVIKLAVIELEPGADPRLVTALRRLGFARKSQNMAYVRGTL